MATLATSLGTTCLVVLAIGVILAIFIAVYLYMKACIYRLKEFERIVVWTWSGRLKAVKGPGAVFVFKPFNKAEEPPIDMRIVPITFERGEICYTSDGAQVTILPAVFYQVVDPAVMVSKVRNAPLAIKYSAEASLRSIVGEMSIDDAITKRDVIKDKIFKSIAKEVLSYGIEVQNVEIVDLVPDIDIYNKMKLRIEAEREAEAKLKTAQADKKKIIIESEAKVEEARLDGDSKRISADAEAYKIKQLAEANRDAEILHAEGESKKIGMIKAALAQKGNDLSSELMIKQRWVEALGSISTSPNSKIVVVPYDLVRTEAWKFATAMDKIEEIK